MIHAAGILSLFLTLPAPGFIVDTWGSDDGAPAAVTSILRTSDGYLWFGSFTGLFRFDGVRFVRMPGLPNPEVIALHQDRAGNIWMGTNGGGLVRWRSGEFQSWTTAEGLSHNLVMAVAEDNSGGIWAATPDGLSRLKDGRIRVFREPEPRNQVLRIQRGASGRLWAATRGGVCEIRDDDVRCDEGSRTTDLGPINAALDARDGAMWIATAGDGFKRLEGSRVTRFAGRSDHVGTLLETRNGDIWAGYGRVGGVSIMRGTQITTLGEADGLPRNTVRAIYEDPEGSIWIGTDGGGIARLRPKRVTAYTRADGLPHDVVKSVAQTTDGTLWAGFNCGPVSRWTGARFEPMFEKEIGSFCTFAVLGARDGSLWIGTWGNGLFRWRDGTLTRYGPAEGLSSTVVQHLFEDSRGGIWAGTDDDDLNYIRDGTISRYSAAEGIGAPRVTSVAETPDGRIWITSANSVSVLSNGRFAKVGVESGLPAVAIGQLFVDGAGDLWVPTEAGMFRRRADRFVSFANAHPALSGMTSLMLEDAAGDLWIGGGPGLTRFLRRELDAFAATGARLADTIVLDRRDGLISGPTGEHAVRGRDGTLWFPTLRGIVAVDPARVQRNTVAAPAVIDGPSSIRIAPGTPAFEFHYAGLSLLDPARVRFRYQLEGFDEHWVDAGTRRTAYYTRMAPGAYTFRVVAANNDGMWGVPAAVTVAIEPFVWETRWFQAAATLLVLALTVASTRAVLLARTRKRIAALEREQALERERTRIARDLHDELGSRLTKIALMADRDQAGLGAEARSAIQAVDELVWTVNARNDSLDAFINYAIDHAREQLQAGGIRLRVDTPPAMPAAAMQADVRRQLLMAFKEALNNAVKHSAASEVRLSFSWQAGVLVIEIRDNGRGFDAGMVSPTGNGLPGMQERLAALGGRTDITSVPGQGTTVRFTLTLPPA